MIKPTVLRLNKEFKTLYYHGKSQVHPLLITYLRRNRYGICRVGITAGKKVGKAVVRNRCRRIIREAYRHWLPQMQGGWDVVFVARARTASAKSTDLVPVMKKHLKEGGALR